MFRRDLELKEKQEHMRKKAEEAMDKIRKQKAEVCFSHCSLLIAHS